MIEKLIKRPYQSVRIMSKVYYHFNDRVRLIHPFCENQFWKAFKKVPRFDFLRQCSKENIHTSATALNYYLLSIYFLQSAMRSISCLWILAIYAHYFISDYAFYITTKDQQRRYFLASLGQRKRITSLVKQI